MRFLGFQHNPVESVSEGAWGQKVECGEQAPKVDGLTRWQHWRHVYFIPGAERGRRNMIPRFVTSLLMAGSCLAQNIDSRMDQIVQSYVVDKQFMGSVLVGWLPQLPMGISAPSLDEQDN
jgi:hypothetical protein